MKLPKSIMRQAIAVAAFLFCYPATSPARLHESGDLTCQIESDGIAIGLPNLLRLAINSSGIYRLRENTEITPIQEFKNREWKKNLELLPLELNETEFVAVKFQGSEVIVSLLLAEEEKGSIPEKVILSLEEFETLGFEFVGSGSASSIADHYSPYESQKVASNRGGRRNRKPRMHFRNPSGATSSGCVAYVQRAIGWRSGPTGNGKYMTSTLRKNGWKPVSCSNPPVGAVASWSGGARGSGHTAVWNGSGWCYDLGCHDPGSKYRLLNCVAR